MRSSRMTALAGSAIVLVTLVKPGSTQQPGERSSGDWPMYRLNYAGTGYSPLKQINSTNVSTLAAAWTYQLQSDNPAPSAGKPEGATRVNSQVTPIVVNGTMYLPAAAGVVALEPETGKERWRHNLTGGAPSRRGVAYWAGNGSMPPRIIFTAGRRLLALDARTGEPAAAFGTKGEVDMVVPYNSVPLIYKNVVVVGANNPPGGVNVPGNARAFDVRTGAKLWEFNSVAQPGDVGHNTWQGDSWRNRAGANAWPFYFTIDERRDLLFLPLASPIPGAYGGDRKGANLYGNSLVAVDVETGKYKWHFQTIHHDLWDHDPPAPPMLFDIVRNGRTEPALGLTTKSGYMYILNRETGRPIFGVEERAVPPSAVPAESAFPTQPFPVKPPPIARNTFSPSDLVTASDTTPEHADACRQLIEKHGISNAGPFTPWAYRADDATPATSVVFPGGLGGANWGGIAFDPVSRFAFVATQDVGALGWIRKSREGSPLPYEKATPDRTGPGRGAFDVPMPGGNWPCQKPPWGRLLAINTTSGDIAWQVPLGITEQLPAGKQNTGRPVLAGAIVTAGGLLFIGSTDDNRFRALDARTGAQLWVTRLENRGNANPMTYLGRDSRQYVAIGASESLVVYAVPKIDATDRAR